MTELNVYGPTVPKLSSEMPCGTTVNSRGIVGHFFKFFIYLFILAVLGLHCCVRAFSSCGVRATHYSGFSCCGTWALGMRASVVAARRLSSCGAQA